MLLARSLYFLNERQEAYALLRWGRNRYPTEFWIHFELGQRMCQIGGPSAAVDLEEAIGCCRAALALCPTAGPVYNFLGSALRSKNRLDEAIDAFHRAIQLAPKEFHAYYNLAITLLKANRPDEALTVFHRAVEIEPNYAPGYYEVGKALADRKLFVDAKAAYRQAITIYPRFTNAHEQLGNLLLNENQLDEAIVEYHKVLVLDPKCALCHYSLGLALLRRGRFAEAKTSAEKALEYLAPDSSLRPQFMRHRERCERLLSLQARLPDFLAGNATYADSRERVELVNLCKYQSRYATAYRLYREAIAINAIPGDLIFIQRYQAACCAVMAADGQGVDADTLAGTARSRWREQALEWLRTDLDSWRMRLETKMPLNLQALRVNLLQWQREADLNCVRQDEALKKLSAEEQQVWRKFWADVAELLAKVGDMK